MNHQKVYESIIQKAKFENRRKLRKNQENYVYYEKHHIVPRCLGGTDDEQNLVLLTAKEHYVCHKLLTYIYPKNRKIAFAFHRMTFGKNKDIISSRDYQYAIELIRLTPISEETRNKIKGHPGWTKGRPLSKEHIEKLSIASSGENNGMYGRKHTPESINKMKNRVFSEKTKHLMKINHANISGKNNPMFGSRFKWMSKNNINKRANWEEIDMLISQGWEFGKKQKGK